MKVNFYAGLRQAVGAKSIELDLPAETRIAGLLAQVVEKYPAVRAKLLDEQGGLLAHNHIFVNGRDILYLPDGPATILDPADAVDIFPPVGGG